MIFAWPQVWAFFTALAAAGWLLYPDEYFRGQMQRDEGDRSRAIEFFSGYLAKHPFNKGATFSLAGAFEAAGRPEEAVPPLLAYYRDRRGDLEAGTAVLQLFERAGLLAQADDFRWELYQDLFDKPAVPRRRLEELAYAAYQRAAVSQDDAGTTRALIALTEVSGEGSGYQGELLRLLLARGETAKALKLLREAVKREPRAADPRRAIARILRLQGDAVGARRELDAGLALTPDSVPLLTDRTALNLAEKRWGPAEKDLRVLVKRQPKETAWPSELARCLLEEGRVAEGVRAYEALIAKDPGLRQAWWSVIFAYADRKMHAEALSVLERYTRRFPDDAHGAEMLVYQAELAGRFDLAIDALRRHLAADPADVDRARSLAGLLIQEERPQEAAEVYEALLARLPDDQDLWRTLAYVHESRRDYVKAAEVLERYRRRFPDDKKAMDELVYDYEAQGEKGKAAALLREYFKAKAGKR